MDQDIIHSLVFPYLNYKRLAIMEEVNCQFYTNVILVYKSRKSFDTKARKLFPRSYSSGASSVPDLLLAKKIENFFPNVENLYFYRMRFNANDLMVLLNLSKLRALAFEEAGIDDVILFSQFLESMAPRLKVLTLHIYKFNGNPADAMRKIHNGNLHIALVNAHELTDLSLQGEYCPRFLPHDTCLKSLQCLKIMVLNATGIRYLTTFFSNNIHLGSVELTAEGGWFQKYLNTVWAPLDSLADLQMLKFNSITFSDVIVNKKHWNLTNLVIDCIYYIDEDFFTIMNKYLGGTLERLEIRISHTNLLPIQLKNLEKLVFLHVEQVGRYQDDDRTTLAPLKLEKLQTLRLINVHFEGGIGVRKFPNLKTLECRFPDWNQFYEICYTNSESLENLELQALTGESTKDASFSLLKTANVCHPRLLTLKLHQYDRNYKILEDFKHDCNLRKIHLPSDGFVTFSYGEGAASNVANFMESMDNLKEVRLNNELFDTLRDNVLIKKALSSKNIVFMPDGLPRRGSLE